MCACSAGLRQLGDAARTRRARRFPTFVHRTRDVGFTLAVRHFCRPRKLAQIDKPSNAHEGRPNNSSRDGYADLCAFSASDAKTFERPGCKPSRKLLSSHSKFRPVRKRSLWDRRAEAEILAIVSRASWFELQTTTAMRHPSLWVKATWRYPSARIVLLGKRRRSRIERRF